MRQQSGLRVMHTSHRRFGQKFRGMLAATSMLAAAMPALPQRAAAQTPAQSEAGSLPLLPPPPANVARFIVDAWGTVPVLRGTADAVTVTYQDHQTRVDFKGNDATVSTQFRDQQNFQTITLTQTLRLGRHVEFDTLQKQADTALTVAQKEKFGSLNAMERDALTAAMAFAQIDDMNTGLEALRRQGINRASVLVDNAPPSLPQQTLAENFGARQRFDAILMINQGPPRARDLGDGRGEASVARPDRLTGVRYIGPVMSVATSFLDRNTGKVLTLRMVMTRGQKRDFREIADGYAASIADKPSLQHSNSTDVRALAGAMALAQLIDVRNATAAQAALPNNSNAVAVGRKTEIINLPENGDALLQLLAQKFGPPSAAAPGRPVPEVSSPAPAAPRR